jgi:hypothetical protein
VREMMMMMIQFSKIAQEHEIDILVLMLQTSKKEIIMLFLGVSQWCL